MRFDIMLIQISWIVNKYNPIFTISYFMHKETMQKAEIFRHQKNIRHQAAGTRHQITIIEKMYAVSFMIR